MNNLYPSLAGRDSLVFCVSGNFWMKRVKHDFKKLTEPNMSWLALPAASCFRVPIRKEQMLRGMCFPAHLPNGYLHPKMFGQKAATYAYTDKQVHACKQKFSSPPELVIPDITRLKLIFTETWEIPCPRAKAVSFEGCHESWVKATVRALIRTRIMDRSPQGWLGIISGYKLAHSRGCRVESGTLSHWTP